MRKKERLFFFIYRTIASFRSPTKNLLTKLNQNPFFIFEFVYFFEIYRFIYLLRVIFISCCCFCYSHNWCFNVKTNVTVCKNHKKVQLTCRWSVRTFYAFDLFIVRYAEKRSQTMFIKENCLFDKCNHRIVSYILFCHSIFP